MPVARRYAILLRTPAVPSRLAATFLSATVLGMLSLTLVLCMRQWTGSTALAGVASGLFSLGNAIGLVVQGRLLDRYPDHRVVIGAGSTCGATLLGLVAAGVARWPVGWVLLLCLLAGVSVPAVTAAVRAWLPTVLASTDLRGAAYALLAVVFQTALAAGPIIVSLCVIVTGPELALGTAALLILLVVRVHTVGSPGAAGSCAKPGGGRARPWARGLEYVLAVAAISGAGFGIVLVTLPSIEADHRQPGLSGLLLGAVALGELAGALSYGARRWPGSRRHQLATALATAAAAYGLAATLIDLTPALVAGLFLSGMAGGPVAVVLSALIDDVTGPGAVAGSYTLLVGAGLVAVAAGSAATGLVADRLPPALLLTVPGVLALVAAGFVLRRGAFASRGE
ncbi:MFS transporter [Jiangella aurantiaca]|uniref:MFS transporter n=1 Tax=Jiangella aurantiaca TaxID=2530373 RepID=A0A4R5AM19_9ACTN|nr:MFS transporter [Jiangella aurantiaca]TDD72579.1 MFS transporter [Jiangella aurantiaca]